MKKQEYVFYDDTHNYDMFDEARDELFEREKDEYGWRTADEVPEDMIYDEIDDINYLTYEDFSKDFDRFIKGGIFIIQGTCGRWDGPAACGRFVRSFNDIREFIQHLDHFKFYEQNGHFYITGYHHDGRDYYELKQLTPKGIELAERNYFAHNRELHNRIMNYNLYSKLPRVFETLYGSAS